MNLIKLSMAVAISAALAACGGGGGGGSSAGTGGTGGTGGGTTLPTAAIKITPMKGKFSAGTTVKVKRAKDGVVVATGTLDATGSVSVNVATSETGPFLIEAGVAGDTYFDESTGAPATVPAGQPALRALIPDAVTSPSVGVTALTEFAVGQVEAGSGVAAVTPIGVMAANATIGSQFGVNDLLTPPTIVAAGTKVNGGNAADDYALKLAGLAKMAKTGVSSVQALHDLRDDIKDGKFDGLKGTTPLTTLAFTVPPAGMTSAELSTQIASQVQAATATYGAASATAPTVTLTVQDLAALLAAAMQVGAEAQAASAGSQLATAQLNTQIASTVNTQVGNIATDVAAGTPIATATTTAVANTTTTATALASAGGTAQTNFMAGIAAGWYQDASWLAAPKSAPPAAAGMPQGQITQRPIVMKSISSGTGSTFTITHSHLAWNFATGVLDPYTPPAGSNLDWTLTATSPGGWVSSNGGGNMTITSNADGTISWSNASDGTAGKFLPSVIVLDGKPLQGCASATNPAGANCTAGDVYPAGSKMYDFVGEVLTVDQYNLWQAGGVATDVNGVPLTALPAVGTSFCANDHLYSAIPGAAAGADNYQVSWTGIWDVATNTWIPGCTAAGIAAAQASQVASNTVLIVNKATGNASVPSVLKIQRVSQTNNVWMLQNVFAAKAGAVYTAHFTPAGPVQNQGAGNLNKAALDAELAFKVARTPVMRYIADATSVAGVSEPWLTGNTTGVTLVEYTRHWVAGAAGTYTQTETISEFTNGAWVTGKTPATETYPAYYLTAATNTWAQVVGLTWTLNPDGTLSTVHPRVGNLTLDIVRTNLSGTSIIDPMTGGIVGTYPANGANEYTQVGATSTIANYRIFVDPWSVVTDAAGVQLTALPAAGATICTNGVVLKLVGANYEAFSTIDCTAANITAATAVGVVSMGVVTLANMPALNGGVAPAVMGITAGPMMNSIIAVAPTGGVYSGQYQPAGKKLGLIFDKNKAAADAEAIALGAMALP